MSGPVLSAGHKAANGIDLCPMLPTVWAGHLRQELQYSGVSAIDTGSAFNILFPFLKIKIGELLCALNVIPFLGARERTR